MPASHAQSVARVHADRELCKLHCVAEGELLEDCLPRSASWSLNRCPHASRTVHEPGRLANGPRGEAQRVRGCAQTRAAAARKTACAVDTHHFFFLALPPPAAA
eukprot:CAMPEP_0170145470 /NCGR_PEP_ID=MMETSP0033_2-20121228/21677_1 /TAXON_ID=195969 /ORGANISM="Dolichomastix tenuilepis, Strain CCMP3274" /LENGTH=103 /DNA_ID=CAMNT_0010382059 /DNA_START=142 /DNA_END=449 /DNA_ORIENTATION=+